MQKKNYVSHVKIESEVKCSDFGWKFSWKNIFEIFLKIFNFTEKFSEKSRKNLLEIFTSNHVISHVGTNVSHQDLLLFYNDDFPLHNF